MQFELGWVMHPVIKGDYPQMMKDTVARRTKEQGFTKSRLPEFTSDQIASLKGMYAGQDIRQFISISVSIGGTKVRRHSWVHFRRPICFHY